MTALLWILAKEAEAPTEKPEDRYYAKFKEELNRTGDEWQ